MTGMPQITFGSSATRLLPVVLYNGYAVVLLCCSVNWITVGVFASSSLTQYEMFEIETRIYFANKSALKC